MKSFTVTLILLGLVVGASIWNFYFVNRTADHMDALISDLPNITDDDCFDNARELGTYWEERVAALGLSIGYTYLDRVGEQIALLSACAEIGDAFGYQTAVALLTDAVKDLRRGERFSIANLL